MSKEDKKIFGVSIEEIQRQLGIKPKEKSPLDMVIEGGKKILEDEKLRDLFHSIYTGIHDSEKELENLVSELIEKKPEQDVGEDSGSENEDKKVVKETENTSRNAQEEIFKEQSDSNYNKFLYSVGDFVIFYLNNRLVGGFVEKRMYIPTYEEERNWEEIYIIKTGNDWADSEIRIREKYIFGAVSLDSIHKEVLRMAIEGRWDGAGRLRAQWEDVMKDKCKNGTGCSKTDFNGDSCFISDTKKEKEKTKKAQSYFDNYLFGERPVLTPKYERGDWVLFEGLEATTNYACIDKIIYDTSSDNTGVWYAMRDYYDRRVFGLVPEANIKQLVKKSEPKKEISFNEGDWVVFVGDEAHENALYCGVITRKYHDGYVYRYWVRAGENSYHFVTENHMLDSFVPNEEQAKCLNVFIERKMAPEEDIKMLWTKDKNSEEINKQIQEAIRQFKVKKWEHSETVKKHIDKQVQDAINAWNKVNNRKSREDKKKDKEDKDSKNTDNSDDEKTVNQVDEKDINQVDETLWCDLCDEWYSLISGCEGCPNEGNCVLEDKKKELLEKCDRTLAGKWMKEFLYNGAIGFIEWCKERRGK